MTTDPETMDAPRIGPTHERLDQAGRVGPDTVQHRAVGGVSVPRMLDGDVLELLRSRGIIDSEEYAVGQDFYRHWYYSGLAASGVIDPAQERVDGGKMEQQSERAAHHLGRWLRMVRSLPMVMSHVLCDCVLQGVPLQTFGLRHCRTTSPRIARERAQDRLVTALHTLVLNELGPRRNAMRGHVGERPGIVPAGGDDAAKDCA